MTAVVKDKHNAAKLPERGVAGQQNRRRGQRGRRWNNAAGAGGSPGQNATAKYATHNKELLENLVFDNTVQNKSANFQRSLKGLANFMHTTYSAKVSEAIPKMQAITISIEEEPTAQTDPGTGQPIPMTSWDEHKWKQNYNEQLKKLKSTTTLCQRHISISTISARRTSRMTLRRPPHSHRSNQPKIPSGY